MPTAIATLSPILAALITATVGLLGLMIAKDAKVSEFRQAWIDKLRAEIADLLTASHELIRMLVAAGETKGPDVAVLNPALRLANTAMFSIRLRLNATEAPSKELLAIIDQIEAYSSSKTFDQDTVENFERRLITATNRVLKAEWDMVRSGEKSYRLARFILGLPQQR